MKILVPLVLSFSLMTSAVAGDQRQVQGDRYNDNRNGDYRNDKGRGDQYVGRQSFRLEDDREFADHMRQVDEAKIVSARLDERRFQIENQMQGVQNQLNQILNQMDAIQKDINDLTAQKAVLVKKLEELNKDAVTNKDEIDKTNLAIGKIDGAVTEKSKSQGLLKLQTAPLNVQLDRMKADDAVATKQAMDAQQNVQALNAKLEQERQSLMALVLRFNGTGADNGYRDGSYDGGALATRMGQDQGSRDGDQDGNYQGTRDGQARFYQAGAAQGEIDGSARAQIDGTRDGNLEGMNAGNTDAGDREGTAAGEVRANKSDAASVGIAQGKTAGLNRAATQGSIDGNNIGETETVNKFESATSKAITINGAYSGTFSRNTPSYPGDFQGSSFNPNIYQSREILRKAYADGYLDQYRTYTRYEFSRQIDGIYTSVYNAIYARSYDDANRKDYPESYNQGRADGDARAYKRDYPIVKTAAYNKAYDQYDSSPNRNSNEFKTQFRISELARYNSAYEEIRSANYKTTELNTYNANIAAQTEIYRQARIGEVTKVYSKNAILKYISSEMLDGGIQGIASLDGIFQPGEKTIRDVVIQNFGLVPATNVSIQLENGAIIKLPAIPAQSIATIKGAGLSAIPANSEIGSQVASKLKVLASLTSDDAVEAIHFDSMPAGVLKQNDTKTVQVLYPLNLSGLSLNSQLIKGTPSKLSLNVTNASKRAYVGDIKVNLLVNSQNNIIKKEFSNLAGIQSSATLNDAEVLVTSDQDVYRDLSFSASIEQNGVTLGVLTSNLNTMAKGSFQNKVGAPVIIANSDTNLNALLDTISELGGTDNVSILDTSLTTLNAATLANGLTKKAIIVLDNSTEANIKSLNAFIAKSNLSSFILVDEANQSLNNAVALPTMAFAQSVLLDSRLVYFSNNLLAPSNAGSATLLQSNRDSLASDLEYAKYLIMSPAEMIAQMKTVVTRESYTVQNSLIRAYTLKSLGQILNINIAYDKSGGIFSKDKKFIAMIESDGANYINALRAAANVPVNEQNIGAILSAISMGDVLGNVTFYSAAIYSPKSEKMTSKVKTTVKKIVDGMNGQYQNNLKKFDKDLYRSAYMNVLLHRPFKMDVGPVVP